MKKTFFCVLLAVMMVFTFAACGAGSEGGDSPTEWSLDGYFTDENNNFLSITYMDDVDEPGWYVGFMNGEDLTEDSYGGILPDEGGVLKGALPNGGTKDDINVTLSVEGENGVLVEVEGGDAYHFVKEETPEATIIVHINTEGMGNIEYTEGEEAPEIDEEYPYQSAQINLAEPTTHTFLAWPQEGNKFVKWTKNGEDFSTDAQITVLLDESADYVAVFEAE